MTKIFLGNLNESNHFQEELESFLKENGANFMQTFMWCSYKKTNGWKTRWIYLKNESGDIISSAIVYIKSKIFNFCYIPRGPIAINESGFEKILETIKKKLNCHIIWISPDYGEEQEWIKKSLRKIGFKPSHCAIQHISTFRIDLTLPINVLLKNMDKKRRYEVRKYEKEKNKWNLSIGNSLENIRIFYKLYSDTMNRTKIKGKTLEDIILMKNFLKNNMKIFLISYRNMPMAGALIITYGKKLWYLLGGSSRQKSNISAGVGLHWEIMQWAKSKGFVEYDLQGTPRNIKSSDPKFGVYLFKKKWGGKLIHLIGEYYYTKIPFLANFICFWLNKHEN